MPVLHPKNWLIFNHRIDLWRGEGYENMAYTANVLDAHLYTEDEAKEITKIPEVGEEMIPLATFKEKIEEFYHTLNPGEFLPSSGK